ncbi:MAG: hypothetical protein GC134_01930 [Proteobacteria bacterium]|nr:hypothetical protein [Pseudomonadota bacterium]
MRPITHHIIHCSDSTFGDVKTIRGWHLQRGFHDVGYHFVIRTDGEIEVGRLLTEVGAHVEGHNSTSIGTCLIGKTDFTGAQFKALRRLHESLADLFPGIATAPHNAFNPHKTCPNFNVAQALKGELS